MKTYPTDAGRLTEHARVRIRLTNGATSTVAIAPTRGSDDHVDVTVPGMGTWTVPVDRKVEVVSTECVLDGCTNDGEPFVCGECRERGERRTAEAWAVMRMSF